MSEGIVYPRKGKTDPQLGPVAVMVATEPDMTLMMQTLGLKGKPTCRVLTSKLYSREFNGRHASIAGPMIGAPHAVMVLEKLIALGAQKVLFFGWCGSLQLKIQIGDFVIPDRAVIGEGTSPYYPIAEECPTISSAIETAISESLERRSLPFHKGAVWSTDAPYRETREKVLALQEDGILGADMEMSALLTVGQFRKVDVGALLVVSDELGSLKWRPGFSSSKFKASRKVAAEVLKEVCLTISE